ncbi:MAG: beta-lactamase family protein [Bacteroidia bacterium]|nr:beta-lactamase family protein [Bacteroidia bacterium]
MTEGHHAPLIVQRLDTLFQRKVQNGFNGNVLISRKGKVIYKKCFGYPDKSKSTELDPTTSFQVASVTKTFTATAILILYQEGKIRLKDKVEKYIKGWPFKGISIDLLLSHRSGLGEYHYFSEKWYPDSETPVKLDDMIRAICDSSPPRYYKPNEKFDYCNTNYIVLARIIEIVGGNTYAEFLEEKIFKPLEMNNTWVGGMYDDPSRIRARGYNSKWEPEKNNFLDGCVGDKGVFTNVVDLNKYDKSFYNHTLLADTVIELMFKPRQKERKGIYNYGYGWRILRTEDSLPVVFHNGWWHGYNSCFYRRLQDSTTIIILGNKFSKEPYRLYGVLGILDNKTAGGDGEIGEEHNSGIKEEE